MLRKRGLSRPAPSVDCRTLKSAALVHPFKLGQITYRVFPQTLYFKVPPRRFAATFRAFRQKQAARTPDEVDMLLSAADETENPKRDRAIMTLATQSGMRGMDITKLKLGDIDWRKNVIHFVQTKTHVPVVASLEHETGNAIVDYFKNERPKCAIQTLFCAVATLSGRLPEDLQARPVW
jgi:integrase